MTTRKPQVNDILLTTEELQLLYGEVRRATVERIRTALTNQGIATANGRRFDASTVDAILDEEAAR